MKNILEFIFRPLVTLLELDKSGRKLYQYLYFTRSGVEGRIKDALKGGHNIVLVAHPGNGKTTCMHYMFIEFDKNEKYHPIILDFKNIGVKSQEGMLWLFLTEMREYFTKIGSPINELQEATTIENCVNHALIIQRHFDKCPKSTFDENKLIIFLDDLDYAEKGYVKMLEKYFLPYMHSSKSTIILSVRPYLYNFIKTYDPLRQYFYTLPRKIELPEDDLELIIHNRLKSIIEVGEQKGFLFKFLRLFREKSEDELLLKYLKDVDPNFQNLNDALPFNDSFYTKLRDITFFNLRIVEEVLPQFIEYQLSGKKPCFNEDFYLAFIELNKNKPHILPDLVDRKTTTGGSGKSGNSILQIVLEYFYYDSVVNERFYSSMKKYGITADKADASLELLSKPPYSMISPQFYYQKDLQEKSSITNTYVITIKGIKYIENILQYDEYYSSRNVTRSNRSLYLEMNKYGYPRNRN